MQTFLRKTKLNHLSLITRTGMNIVNKKFEALKIPHYDSVF